MKKLGATTTYYYYDRNGQLIAELDGSGNTVREYVYLDGQPLALVTGGNIYTMHTDHLGTPQVITNGSQAVVWQADYEPFGSVNITTEIIDNNLRFPGQYYDQETGLHYNKARDYDPSTGRYIESDVIGLKGGISTYGYTLQNPIKYADPTGMFHVSGNTGPRDKNDFATVVCDGQGGFKPELFIDEPCINDCLKQHEKSHIEDIQMKNPNICRGMKPGLRIDPDNYEEWRATEKKAYNVELDCLNAKLKCPNSECVDQILNRKTDILLVRGKLFGAPPF